MGKYIIAAIGLCLMIHSSYSEENALKNGDFSKGKMGWKMDTGVRVQDITDPAGGINRAVEVQLDSKKTKSLTTQIDVSKKATALQVSLRLKAGRDFISSTPDGNQYTLRMKRPDGSATLTDRKLAVQEDWEQVTWDFSQLDKARSITFSIEMLPGSGAVWLDDVVIKEL